MLRTTFSLQFFLVLPLVTAATSLGSEGSANGTAPDSAMPEASIRGQLRGSTIDASAAIIGVATTADDSVYTIENMDPDRLKQTYESECGGAIHGVPTLQVKWLSAQYPCDASGVNVWKPGQHKWNITCGGVDQDLTYYYIESIHASNCGDKYLRSSRGGKNPCPSTWLPSSDRPVLGARKEKWIFERDDNEEPNVYRIFSLERKQYEHEHGCGGKVYLTRHAKCNDVVNFQAARHSDKQKWRLDKPLPTTTTTTAPGCVPKVVKAKWKWTGQISNGNQEIRVTYGTKVSESRTTTEGWERAVSSSFQHGFKAPSAGGYEWSFSVTGAVKEDLATAFSEATEKSREDTYAAHLGPGVVWKWVYYFDDDPCGSGDTMVHALFTTNSLLERPCCIPGLFVNNAEPHGPCLNSTNVKGVSEPVCFCSEEVCTGR